MARIFISYSRVDKPFVESLYKHLESVYGAGSIWYDKDIRGGEDFWNRICDEIDHADVFLYLLSPESIASTWCNAEYDEADRLNTAIIPILVRDRTPIIPKVGHLNVLDMSSGADDTTTLNKLYQTINPIFYGNISLPAPKTLSRTPYPGERQEPTVIPEYNAGQLTQGANITGNENRVSQTQNFGIDGRWIALILLIVVAGFIFFFTLLREDETPPVTLAYEFLVDTSGLMSDEIGGIRRIEIVSSAVGQIVDTFDEQESWRGLRVAGGTCERTEQVHSGTDVVSNQFVASLNALEPSGVNAYRAGIDGLTRDLSEDIPRTSEIRVAFLFLGSVDSSPCRPQVNFAEQFDKFAQYNISTTLCTFVMAEDDEAFSRFRQAMIAEGFTCVHNEDDPQQIANIAIQKIEQLIQIDNLVTLTPFPTSPPSPTQEIPIDGTEIAQEPTSTETTAPTIMITKTSTATLTNTATATDAPSPTHTLSPSPIPSPTETLTPTLTLTPTQSEAESQATLTALNITVEFLTEVAGVPLTQTAEAIERETQESQNEAATQQVALARQAATDDTIATQDAIATEEQALLDTSMTLDAIATDNAQATQFAIATQLQHDILTITAQFIETQRSEDATATAESWTDTPTPTLTTTATPTLDETVTAQFVETQNVIIAETQESIDATSTAESWTATPTLTATLEATETPDETATAQFVETQAARWVGTQSSIDKTVEAIRSKPNPSPTESTASTFSVSNTSVNIRTGPDVLYPVLASARQGETFDVRAKAWDDDRGEYWYLIDINGRPLGWIAAGVGKITNASDVEIAVTVPPIPITNTPDPRPPVIENIERTGTCASHTYIITWSDPSGDASRIVAPDSSSGESHRQISGKSGTYTWSGWTCPDNSTGCSNTFHIVDRAGNISNSIRPAAIMCDN